MQATKKRGRDEPIDLTIQCKDCAADFVFTAKEQHFFATKGFPAKVRCSDCVAAKRGQARNAVAAKVEAPAATKSAVMPRCFNCGKKGHMSSECTQPQGSTACFICGGEGHLSRDCPEAPEKPSVSETRCFNCGKQGHLSAACDQPKKSATACHACGKEGHTARACPEPWLRAEKLDVPKIEALIVERKALRASGDYVAADKVKVSLKALGVTVQDAEGTWSAAGKRKDKAPRKQGVQVCFAFQKFEGARGDACRFAHVRE